MPPIQNAWGDDGLKATGALQTKKAWAILLALAVSGLFLSGGAAGQATPPATNLIPNPGAEKVMPSASFPAELAVRRTQMAGAYPESWAVYNGNGYCRWGSVDEAHSGRHAVFLTMTPADGATSSVNLGLCLGGGNGYSGAGAIPVQGNRAYYFAFYARGDMAGAGVRITGWRENNLSHKGRRVLETPLDRIELTDEWQLFEGYFVTPDNITRLTPMVHISLSPDPNRPEQTIYLDDAVLTPYAPARLDQGRPDPIRVAVYENAGKLDPKPSGLGPQGRAQILQTLQTAPGIAPCMIDTLCQDSLAECDVILFSNILKLSPADQAAGADWELALLNFVDSGKGVILGHDSVGWRGVFGKSCLFSLVCTGRGLALGERDLTAANAQHPVMQGLPASFQHAYDDHVAMIAAPGTDVLARNRLGEPAVLAGGMSRGRVVAVGFPMGLSVSPANESGKEPSKIQAAAPLTDEEARLLINSVRWCAEPPRFAIPALLTKATLGKQVRAYNHTLKEAAARYLTEFKPHPEYQLTMPRPGREPIGGGQGYSKIPDMARAEFLPETRAGLLAALIDAQPGALIYIPDTAEIDLSGINEITIPAGVTLASGRGRILEDDSVSAGALLHTVTHGTLFVVNGPGVRLTGFRLGGPAPDRAPAIATSLGVISDFPVEIDNCRWWGWVRTIMARGRGSHIHNNVIHHAGGLGYGVQIGSDDGQALIEENIFDYMRHAVAAGGTAAYEARYNITGRNMFSGSYDMHGANDKEKTYMLANWRFDVLQDDNALNYVEGTALKGSPCRLTVTGARLEPNTDRDGWFDQALRFSGQGDFAVCDRPPAAFQTAVGAVEFRVKTALDNGPRPVVCQVQDRDNLWLLRINSHGRLQLIVKIQGDEKVNLTSAKILTPRWHHVAVQQLGGAISMAIDAVQSELSGQGLRSREWTQNLQLDKILIGRDASDFFAGVLDEVRIYNRPLTSEQIQQHYRYPDLSGAKVELHHNTLYSSRDNTICLRGIPMEITRIHHNHFVEKTDPGQAVWQYAPGGGFKRWSQVRDGQWRGVRVEVSDNFFGPIAVEQKH